MQKEYEKAKVKLEAAAEQEAEYSEKVAELQSGLEQAAVQAQEGANEVQNRLEAKVTQLEEERRKSQDDLSAAMARFKDLGGAASSTQEELEKSKGHESTLEAQKRTLAEKVALLMGEKKDLIKENKHVKYELEKKIKQMRREFEEEEERSQGMVQRQAILYETTKHKVTEMWAMLDRAEKVLDAILDECEEDEPNIAGFVGEADDLMDDIIEMRTGVQAQKQNLAKKHLEAEKKRRTSMLEQAFSITDLTPKANNTGPKRNFRWWNKERRLKLIRFCKTGDYHRQQESPKHAQKRQGFRGARTHTVDAEEANKSPGASPKNRSALISNSPKQQQSNSLKAVEQAPPSNSNNTNDINDANLGVAGTNSSAVGAPNSGVVGVPSSAVVGTNSGAVGTNSGVASASSSGVVDTNTGDVDDSNSAVAGTNPAVAGTNSSAVGARVRAKSEAEVETEMEVEATEAEVEVAKAEAMAATEALEEGKERRKTEKSHDDEALAVAHAHAIEAMEHEREALEEQAAAEKVRCGAMRCGAVRCGAARCGAVRCSAVRCGVVRCGAARSFMLSLILITHDSPQLSPRLLPTRRPRRRKRTRSDWQRRRRHIKTWQWRRS